MILNTYGEIVKQQWIWLSNQYDYVKLDEYIVMPNHVHGILMIYDQNLINQHRRDQRFLVPTGDMFPAMANAIIPFIASIIRGFKIGVTKWIHQNDLNHSTWQKRLNLLDHT